MISVLLLALANVPLSHDLALVEKGCSELQMEHDYSATARGATAI